MVQQFLYTLIISAVCITWGLPVILLQSKKNNSLINSEEIILAFFTGLSILSLFAAWTCLFFPLKWTLAAGATFVPLLLTIILLRKKKVRLTHFKSGIFFNSINITLLVFVLISIFLFLALDSNTSTMRDTGLYHLQIIRWNHEYGTVHGLANLDFRYGFYSNWFSLISLFLLPFKNENFLFLNITSGIWFLLFLVQRVSFHLQRYRITKTNSILTWMYTLIIAISFAEWELFRQNASSTSYDFIVTILTLILLLTITEDFISTTPRKNLIPLLILASSVPFFKLSGAPVLFIVLIYLLCTRKEKKFYLTFISILVVFAIPFVYRNYIQSGYPVYPYTFFSSGSPDWQVPLQMTKKIGSFISLYNKYLNQQIPVNEWTHPSFDWMWHWFANIPVTSRAIIVLALIGVPVLFFQAKNIMKSKLGIISIYSACWASLLLWFISSPDPRFAYAYLLFIIAVPFSLIAAKILNSRLILFLYAASVVGILIYSLNKIYPNQLISPEQILIPQTNSTVINNKTYNLITRSNETTDRRCNYCTLPCIYEINPYLEQRGNSLKDGFRMTKDIDPIFIINYKY
jgi:hypothetical protein